MSESVYFRINGTDEYLLYVSQQTSAAYRVLSAQTFIGIVPARQALLELPISGLFRTIRLSHGSHTARTLIEDLIKKRKIIEIFSCGQWGYAVNTPSVIIRESKYAQEKITTIIDVYDDKSEESEWPEYNFKERLEIVFDINSGNVNKEIINTQSV